MSRNEKSPAANKLIKHNYITILLCIAGVALNLLLSDIVSRFQFPIYLDTVGTIGVAVMGGYLPGVIVGFVTNMLRSISEPSARYYAFLNVLIALTASMIAQQKKLRKWQKILLAIVLFSLIGGGMGTLIPWYLEGVSFDSASLAAKLQLAGVANPLLALLLANLIADFADKAISVIIAVVLVWLLPQKIHSMFLFFGWMQKPLSSEDSAAAKKINFRVMSLRTKIMLVMSLSLVGVSAAATGISMLLYRSALIKDYIKLAESTVNIAANVVDISKIDTYLAEGGASEEYKQTEQLLYSIRDSSPDIVYLYVYRMEQDGGHIIFDLDTEDTPALKCGEVFGYDAEYAPQISDMLAGKPNEPIITESAFGWLLTVYTPVSDADGNCACYIAADVSMNQIRQTERSFFAEMLSLFLGIFILIFVLIRWLVEYHIILPVNSIAMSTGTFAYDSETARENSIERIHELNIHTGDEVENLYHAITKTSDDSMRYVADVQEKTEQLAMMQRALIMVLADIVESRDKNTGAHVRKTAAYAEIILKEMRNRGYYADQLTDAFISDVVYSAPLHDVGKIQVPDAILNKPGRLDDAEFQVMKTHTTAGRDIISQAIALVPASGYLYEARNLAGYHHEKWDGSGYPDGIAGEDIPLSARVMAVADVFDALVSKRSYKKPFSFEEAMKIITDGSGKHFDPLVVEAFVGAEEEVRRVEREFSAMTNEAGCFK